MSDVNLGRYIQVLRKWLWLPVLAVAIAAGASYYAGASTPPVYRTIITLQVGESIANPTVTNDELGLSQRAAAAYATMVRRQPIMEATIAALGLPTNWRDLQGRVLVFRLDNSPLLELRIVDSDPERAQATASEVANQLIQQSPTADATRQLEDRRRFVRQQLDRLQATIEQTEVTLAEKQASLEHETSARAVLDLQDEVRALDLRLTSARATYASLVAAADRRGPTTISVIEPAFLPTEPITPDLRATVLLGAVVGLLLSLAAIFLIEYFNDTVGTPEDVVRILGLSILGSVPSVGRIRAAVDTLVVARTPRAAIAEAFRVLRTNILFARMSSGPDVLLVTSPSSYEGKSFVSANLAVSLAESGRRTILVDADLRRPSQQDIFGLGGELGLASLLHDRTLPDDRISPAERLREQLDECLVRTDVPNLVLLPSGPVPASAPVELLASPRMEQLLRVLQGMADVVVLDSPPILPVADSAILAGHGASVVLVVQAGKTRARAASLAAAALVRARAHVLGVVLNAVPPTSVVYGYPSEGAERRFRLPSLSFPRRRSE